MFTNDLSDNGKSFEFGYDSENDSYGYYKNGTFTEFGGGGLSTQCIVKGIAMYNGTVSSSNPTSGYVMYCDDDGSTQSATGPVEGNIHAKYQEILENCSFIRSTVFTSTPGYYAYTCALTFAKDGYYMISNVCNAPTFYTAGTTVSITVNTQSVHIVYLGIQAPN